MREELQVVRAFGPSSLAADESELMAKTVHDLRGGAMSALLGQLQLAELQTPDEPALRQLFFLTRDHLKIMRNALLGLDDPKREADLQTRMHSIDLIAEKVAARPGAGRGTANAARSGVRFPRQHRGVLRGVRRAGPGAL